MYRWARPVKPLLPPPTLTRTYPEPPSNMQTLLWPDGANSIQRKQTDGHEMHSRFHHVEPLLLALPTLTRPYPEPPSNTQTLPESDDANSIQRK